MIFSQGRVPLSGLEQGGGGIGRRSVPIEIKSDCLPVGRGRSGQIADQFLRFGQSQEAVDPG